MTSISLEAYRARAAAARAIAAVCQHCGSETVTWFTPPTSAHRGTVLLCQDCSRLTVVGPISASRSAARPAQPLRRAA
jgi:hypothetical protein